MERADKDKNTGTSSPGGKRRNMKDYYSVLIKLIADAAQGTNGNAGSGNAPEDPSLEIGKVR